LALVSDERARATRQELLAKYYLEPSKQRSEEASKILSDAVIDARLTLRVLRRLNIVVFIVGILLLVTGTIAALISDELATRLVGVLAGIGGLAGVLFEMIKNPLDRIQNAMADLVQIETAFTAFIWELNLNGTFIQSQYVAEGVLKDEEIGQTVKRIEDAMTLALDKVAVYTKVGQQRVISRIYDLTPAAGAPSTTVTIHGQHLSGDKTEKKEDKGILAIDHKPIKAENLEWKDQKVSFKLPTGFNGNEAFDGTIWISLLVDGMETNALPFKVIAAGS
jgi:IPT/TIG domain-containing protein